MSTAKPLLITIGKDIRLEEIPDPLDRFLRNQLEIPNPKWLENERMGRWNWETPKTLCFYTRTPDGGLILPRGTMGHLIRRCKNEGIAYRIDDHRRSLPFLDFTFSGKLKPFQKAAVEALRPKHFGTLSAPTGSGKTIMAMAIIADRRQPALIIVHTQDLADQWVKRIESFLNIPEADMGRLGGGKKNIGTHITVALVQSLYKCAEEIAPRIGFLIVDECHRCPSRTFTEAVSLFDSKYMLGLSATPWRRDNLSKLIFWHLGDIQYSIDKHELVSSGDILPAQIIERPTEFKAHHDPAKAYSKMLAELTADDLRNRLIASDVAIEAEKTDGICLVLSDRKQHCETLRAILAFRHKIAAELLTGDVDAGKRALVLKELAEGNIKVLIATGQLLGEGFDCPNLSSLFLATPIRFSGRVLQYIGRVLRPAPGKHQARIFDYVDVQVGVLKSAADARQKVYQGEICR
ncbi:MAG: DEAD/DEAH box helicase [Deltaproteobacteria bacterium]|nr:DEAD/DEAH box helicase [Deltaproteobacteria bacterium]